MSEKLIGVDLFAGAGGLSLGFEQAGFTVCAAVEYDPIHAATHEYNFPDCATICQSVADISGAYIRDHSVPSASREPSGESIELSKSVAGKALDRRLRAHS